MPAFHCHLPREEDEKMPEDDEVIADDNVEERVDVSSENGDGERSGLTSSDDEDESSEASSIMNDMTIRPWVPIVSSSEEDGSEAGFWTPPSTMGDDVDEVVPSNTAPLISRRPNTARRSRASRPGVFAVRRGRHRQPVAEQEFYYLTPFERGLTFNGFAHDLEPEEIVGHQLDGYRRDLLYRVKWRTLEEPKLIEASVMKEYRNDLIVDYFETRVKEDL